jgi:hypothetical protein
MYFNCVEGCNEILRECWNIYHNVKNDPRITQWHKIAALRLAADIHDKKFDMFQNGPAIIYLGKLHKQVGELRRFAIEERSNGGTLIKRSDSPYHDFNVRDMDKP